MWRIANFRTNQQFATHRLVTISSPFGQSRIWRLPGPLAVFNAWLESHNLRAEISSAGRIAEQIFQALGSVHGISLIGKDQVLKLLNNMANGQIETEVDVGDSKRMKHRLRANVASKSQMLEVLGRANNGIREFANNHLAALLRAEAIKLGTWLQCPQCLQRTWYALSELDTSLQCERCLRQFDFPSSDPPRKAWAYRTIGPFAVENFAQGAYTVCFALHFVQTHIASEVTWVPSFTLRGGSDDGLESDFAFFVRPGRFSSLNDPVLLLGECKTFDRFEPRDVARMERLGELFPGAVLCFCTLSEKLSEEESKSIARLTRRGRRRLATGQQTNPVLVLTKAEMLGQFELSFRKTYEGKFASMADGVYLRGDLQEMSDFSQQVHLGIESYIEWLRPRLAARALRARADKAPPSSGGAVPA